MSDRETWERFAAAVVCGIYADPTAGALRDEWLVQEADRFLALTKERWPEKTVSVGCETVTPATAGDETVTEPGPGEGYRWVRRGEILRDDDQCKPDRMWVKRNKGGDECLAGHFYRRRIDAAPQPSSGACQLPAEGDGVEGLPTVGWWKGELVSRADAERLIAAARREAEEARAECERLRITDAEREAIDVAIGREIDAEWYGGPEPERVVTLRALQKRHTRETVGG